MIYYPAAFLRFFNSSHSLSSFTKRSPPHLIVDNLRRSTLPKRPTSSWRQFRLFRFLARFRRAALSTSLPLDIHSTARRSRARSLTLDTRKCSRTTFWKDKGSLEPTRMRQESASPPLPLLRTRLDDPFDAFLHLPSSKSIPCCKTLLLAMDEM